MISSRIVPSAIRLLKNHARESNRISWELFKVMIPVIIVVKILDELGMVEWLGGILAPAMTLVGLPGDMGLVWATALVTNIYGGIVVYASLTADAPLTVAQITILTTMILVAHSLPVELGIARKAGARIRVMGPFRLLAAYAIGLVLFHLFRAAHWGEEMSVSLWKASPEESSLWRWAWGQIWNLGFIYVVLFGLLIVTKSLDRFGVADLLAKGLRPLLVLMGIGKSAATITIIGMTLGLSYGGALIIRESQSGRVPPSDVFLSLGLMGLCHSLIEDTLLMITLGASAAGVLWARLVFSIAVIAVLARLVAMLPRETARRFLYAPTGSDQPSAVSRQSE